MVDLNNIQDIDDLDGLIEAVQMTYDPDLRLSPSSIVVIRTKIKAVARRLGYLEDISDLIAEYSRENAETDYQQQIRDMCDKDGRGNILCTIPNFMTIMYHDPRYSGLKLNEMAQRYEIEEDGKTRPWTDADDAASRGYIERAYHIHNVSKHDDAMSCIFKNRSYHPIKQVIESIEWDGVQRIPNLLTKWMRAEDSEYTREVSRLIFAGGINRLYRPGCKFEDMPVLLGKQGNGKSSFVRFLAIEDRFFTELKTIEGKESLEAINGAWIVEVSELLALTKTKEQEAVKSFLSTQVDKYRAAYARRTSELPRTCAFVGTTNRYQFVTDKTGGRRFYPVYCHTTGYELFDHEQECREYIRQCWAEAYAKRNTDYMAPYASKAVKSVIEEQQTNATEDDYRVGMILSYLEKTNRDRVCVNMLWEEALGVENRPADRADQTQIGLIMQDMPGWKRSNYRYDFGRYGKQRHWKRVLPDIEGAQLSYETPNDETPF